MGARPWAEGYFEALAFVLSEFLHHAPGSKNKPKDAQAEPDRTYPSLDSATPTAATFVLRPCYCLSKTIAA
jgi:hypothetical protein